MNSVSRDRPMSCLQDNDRRVLLQHADMFLEYSLVFEELVPAVNMNYHYKNAGIKLDRTISIKDECSGR